MKRIIFILTFLVLLTIACSLSGDGEAQEEEAPPPQSENRCGDSVCDGPENAQNCPQDCQPGSADAGDSGKPAEETGEHAPTGKGDYGILYQIIDHAVVSHDIAGDTCFLFSFRQYLDGGYVQPDGSGNEILEMKDHPTSMLTSKQYGDYYYISSPVNPVSEQFGFSFFNWDVENQTLWSADFASRQPVEVAKSTGEEFPGGAAVSSENKYLVYLMTRGSGANQQPGGGMPNKMNPFLSDSSLMVETTKNGETRTALSGNYNRQLFTSFADFSPDGGSFYTIAREGESFKFVKISLESGQVSDFREVFPAFDWGQVNWDEFFPKSGDFAYASFRISPDETRLVVYKSIATTNPGNPCSSRGAHNMWVFNLEEDTIERFENQTGYIVDAAWKYDSAEFALVLIDNSGCYPEYLNARIDLFDKNGENRVNLVSEPESRITNLGWSPDGKMIVYDTYSTDFIGRIKRVDVQDKRVSEIINTQTLGYEASKTEPVTLLFADFVVR